MTRFCDTTLRSRLVMWAVLASISAAANGQVIEYGEFSELRSVERYYVDTGEYLDLRNIIKAILEKNLTITVVEKPEDADHIIVFRWVDGGSVWRGHAIVARRLAPDRIRVLSNYRATETELNDLADEYAKWLVKRLKEVMPKPRAG